jgi:biopolymer transport protein ExbD
LPHSIQGEVDPAAVQRYLEHIAQWARSGQNKAAFSKRRRRARRKVWTMSLNLTPMIDLVFLLLFFFLTVSRFAAREGTLPAQIPARAVAVSAEVPRTPIRVRLEAEPGNPQACRATIERFNESSMAMSELAGALRKIREMNVGFDGQTPVHLKAGDEIAWDHVVNAYNAAFAAEFTKIYFAGSQ